MFGSVQTEARLLEVGGYIALRVALKNRTFRRPEARFFRSAAVAGTPHRFWGQHGA